MSTTSPFALRVTDKARPREESAAEEDGNKQRKRQHRAAGSTVSQPVLGTAGSLYGQQENPETSNNGLLLQNDFDVWNAGIVDEISYDTLMPESQLLPTAVTSVDASSLASALNSDDENL